MATSISKYVCCPFYIDSETHAKGSVIRCEGYYPGTTISLVFTNKGEEYYHRASYCHSLSGYKHCAVCKMLMRKYDD